MKTAIPYYRVSTERQGLSGLGLDAQQSTVEEFAHRYQLTILNAYVEIETGRKSNRPILQEALAQCRKTKSVLLIAKLDRLARNVVFVSSLMEAQVEFIAVDNPFANKLIVHIMAAFAEHERDQISQRTKDALKAARARGVVLGRHGKEVLSKKNHFDSQRFALNMKPIIETIQSGGLMTIREITAELNRRRIPTFMGGDARWHIPTVHKLLRTIKNNSHSPNN